jgi:hypothetical protein
MNTQDKRQRTKEAANMGDENERSVGSAGSHREPVAWAAVGKNGVPMWLAYHRQDAEGAVVGMAEVVPLYRSPTLTDEEREALKKVLRRVREDYFAGRFADSVEVAAVIDGLLERTK